MADLRAIGTALGSYQVDYNQYPTKSAITAFTIATIGDATAGPSYYKGSVKDGWGNAYQYKSDGQSYTLCSTGKGAGTTEFERDLAHIDGSMVEAGVFAVDGCK